MAQENCSGFNVSKWYFLKTKCGKRDGFRRAGHIYVIVDLLENSAHHILITMWDMLVTWSDMGIYTASSKYPMLSKGHAT